MVGHVSHLLRCFSKSLPSALFLCSVLFPTAVWPPRNEQIARVKQQQHELLSLSDLICPLHPYKQLQDGVICLTNSPDAPSTCPDRFHCGCNAVVITTHPFFKLSDMSHKWSSMPFVYVSMHQPVNIMCVHAHLGVHVRACMHACICMFV